jgi:hypothetical protein
MSTREPYRREQRPLPQEPEHLDLEELLQHGTVPVVQQQTIEGAADESPRGVSHGSNMGAG